MARRNRKRQIDGSIPARVIYFIHKLKGGGREEVALMLFKVLALD